MKRIFSFILLATGIALSPCNSFAQETRQPSKHALRFEIGESNGSFYSTGFAYERDINKPWRLRAGVSLGSMMITDLRNRRDFEDGDLDYNYATATNRNFPISISFALNMLHTKQVSEKMGLYCGPGISMSYSSAIQGHTSDLSMSSTGAGLTLLFSIGAEYALSDRLTLQAQSGLSLYTSLSQSVSDGIFSNSHSNHSTRDQVGSRLDTRNSNIGLKYTF